MPSIQQLLQELDLPAPAFPFDPDNALIVRDFDEVPDLNQLLELPKDEGYQS